MNAHSTLKTKRTNLGGKNFGEKNQKQAKCINEELKRKSKLPSHSYERKSFTKESI